MLAIKQPHESIASGQLVTLPNGRLINHTGLEFGRNTYLQLLLALYVSWKECATA